MRSGGRSRPGLTADWRFGSIVCSKPATTRCPDLARNSPLPGTSRGSALRLPRYSADLFMGRVLRTDLGRELYQKQRRSIEPVFGQIKHNRGMTRLRRRGGVVARSEWRLIAATHNLLKLSNHWIAATG